MQAISSSSSTADFAETRQARGGQGDGDAGGGGAGHAGTLVLRWLGRGLGLFIGLFWAIFFFEHVHEWYIHRPTESFPPPWVTLAMVAHGGMVLGLLALMRWEKTGVVLATCSTLAFFFLCIAGTRAPWLVMINFVPIGLVAMSWAVPNQR
ncbi:MAG: hypothetical protein U0570_11480 [Phycisphaerales bacterium]